MLGSVVEAKASSKFLTLFMLVLLTYDIPQDAMRVQVAKLAEGYGERVQQSVFECHVSAAEYRTLRQDVQRLLAADPQASVRCYRLCPRCSKRTQCIGLGTSTDDPAYFVV